MNEHIWKKLGEVKAFARACADFLSRGKDGFIGADIFTAEEIEQFVNKNEDHIAKIDKIAGAADATKIVDTKSKATGSKLEDMQGRYLANEDDWADGMELLEWSGFFFGGAVVHWSLIEGVSESIHEADLTALAGSGLGFHTQMFETVRESISRLAKEEAAQ
ncbi:MAG: hypothetical protein WD335_01640 [Candidatus Paceibacterota bacterium]